MQKTAPRLGQVSTKSPVGPGALVCAYGGCKKVFFGRTSGGKQQRFCSKACRVKHHAAGKYASDPEKHRKARAEWREANRERDRETMRRWGRDNRDRRKELDKAYRDRHPERRAASNARWRASNVEHVRRKGFENTLWRDYGLTVAQYDSMLTSQGGRCALCRGVQKDAHRATRMDVDHDHVTGRVRGLLCRRCNLDVAFFEKLSVLSEKVMAYLQRDCPATAPAVMGRIVSHGRSATWVRLGVSWAAYYGMLAGQGGACAICSGQQVRNQLFAVDHDHVTGEVRGLLCDPCNLGLGAWERLASIGHEKVAEYLKPTGVAA